MGSGIALAIKNRYPAAYTAYKHYTKIELGDISCGWVENRKIVVNLHAQEFYGSDCKRYLNYEALYLALEKMKRELTRLKINSLGVPYNMGCDRAGGNWNVVEAMINAVFEDTDIHTFAIKLP
jgi:O-acetyl-ADP-ribose deacetylase (regulator of RNase III)